MFRLRSNDWCQYVKEVELMEPIKLLSDGPTSHSVALADALRIRLGYLVGKEDNVIQGFGPSVNNRIEASRR
jgi:hypothetical protein